MIWKVFIAALLFEIASAPIVCAIISYTIGAWHEAKLKYTSKLLIAAGQDLIKKSKEGTKTNDQP